MGDLKAKVRAVAVEVIIRMHWVSSIKNGYGEQIVELCAEKGVMKGNSLFKRGTWMSEHM